MSEGVVDISDHGPVISSDDSCSSGWTDSVNTSSRFYGNFLATFVRDTFIQLLMS